MIARDLYRQEKRRAYAALAWVGVISVISSFCLLAVPLYLFQVYDRVLTSRSVETLFALTVIVCVLLTAFGILDAIRQTILARVGVRFETRILGLVLAGELSDDKGKSAGTFSRVAELRRMIGSRVFPNLFDLPLVGIFLVIVFLIHPILGSIVVAGIVVLVVLALIGEWLSVTAIRRVRDSGDASRRGLENVAQQQELVRALGLYRQVSQFWGRVHSRHLSDVLSLQVKGDSVSSASRMARQIIQIAMIGGGASLVLRDEVTPGVIFATSVVASRALAPIEGVVGGWSQLRQAWNSLGFLQKRFDAYQIRETTTPVLRPHRRLVLERVNYIPPGGRQPILRSVTGAVEAGQLIAMIGPSGAGKSTLARLMAGALSPSTGQVLLDGQALGAWDVEVRGTSMGYMPQQVSFFEGTVRENIARLRLTDPPELAIEAAKFAGIHEMIMAFPHGYETVISEGGFQPSGGQKQLLGLARAYYRQPAFVVLDEPNANLDSDGEALLLALLRRAKEAGIATVIVTQRTSVLQHVDKVLIMRNGTVDSFGPPAEVLPKRTVRALPGRAS